MNVAVLRVVMGRQTLLRIWSARHGQLCTFTGTLDRFRIAETVISDSLNVRRIWSCTGVGSLVGSTLGCDPRPRILAMLGHT